jgi:Fe-S cluster assembly protein SufB
MGATEETIATVADMAGKYEAGFITDIESDKAPKGLSEDIVRFISAKKEEPEWMLEWRLKAYRRWLEMPEPQWQKPAFPEIDYQAYHYYSAPKSASDGPKTLDDVDPILLETYEKLGIPLREQEILAGVQERTPVAVDVVFDSVSVATTFKKKLEEVGVIFCSISEAIQNHPELVKKYIGSVVPAGDNKHSCLNSAVFTDGSFVYIPPGVRCPMELSTYFRINELNTGQFERTLIIADKGSSVSYLEGCTAPMRDENQLHAAVVELVALDDAEIKYSTVQNWYPGDFETGKGGVFNFVTKRGLCEGRNSKISWTQVETGSAITWKYPSCILKGDNSQGEFYSVAITNGRQQADTGTKMIHIGKNTKSRIVAKGISAGKSDQTYRGLVKILPGADGARNFTQCDSLLIGDQCGAHTVPYIESRNKTANLEHEATTSKISEDQMFYCGQRGIGEEEALALIVNGFAKEVMQHLPMEFAVEAQKLVGISLEGSVG